MGDGSSVSVFPPFCPREWLFTPTSVPETPCMLCRGRGDLHRLVLLINPDGWVRAVPRRGAPNSAAQNPGAPAEPPAPLEMAA